MIIRSRWILVVAALVALAQTGAIAGDLPAGGHVLLSKHFPTPAIADSKLRATEMFIDGNDNTFIIVGTSGFRGEHHYSAASLYMNDTPIDLQRYGKLWNGFLKDRRFHVFLFKDQTILIYKFEKDIKLVTSISIAGSLGNRLTGANVHTVIPVPTPGNSYYLLARRWTLPVHPGELAKTILSGGHGIAYWKPFLVEVQDGKLAKPQKLRYGGKMDESYYIKQVVRHEDLVHFLGFRKQEQPAAGPRKRQREPVILHHAAYDMKKKKVIQNHAICRNIPKVEKDKNRISFYGLSSIDALGNDVFVAFSWIQQRLQPRPIPRDEIESSIFYWQHSNGTASDVEKIADGFLPLVKVDSSGTVHLLWVNKDGSLVHKARRNGKWSKDTVLANNLEDTVLAINCGMDYGMGIIDTKCVSAEFDKDNNLHVVYPSGDDLVHAVVKVN